MKANFLQHFSDTSHWFIFVKDHIILLQENGRYLLPNGKWAGQLQSLFIRQHSLLGWSFPESYCAELANIPEHLSCCSIPLKKALALLSVEVQKAAIRAFAILNWDRHPYCGQCGGETEINGEPFERKCQQCGFSHFPRISPSVIVLIKKERQILMARSPHFPPGVHALIAGFVELGESLEDTIHREVQEEVGLQVHHLRYYGSQAWPFPDSLMIGFIADYAGGEIVIDTKEIDVAGWYDADQIPGYPSSSTSIAAHMIDDFINHRI